MGYIQCDWEQPVNHSALQEEKADISHINSGCTDSYWSWTQTIETIHITSYLQYHTTNSFNTKPAYVLCASWLLLYCMVSNFKVLWQFLTDVSENLTFCQRHLRDFLSRMCPSSTSVSFSFSSVNNQHFHSVIALPSTDPVCLILFTIVKNIVSICSCNILKFMVEYPLSFSCMITFRMAIIWTLNTCDITTQDKPWLQLYGT